MSLYYFQIYVQMELVDLNALIFSNHSYHSKHSLKFIIRLSSESDVFK